MTVYELIQELTNFEPDREVIIEAGVPALEVTCDCGEAITVPGETFKCDIDSVRAGGSYRNRTLSLICEVER